MTYYNQTKELTTWFLTTHFIADCPKRKKLNSNKYDYIKRNEYSKGNDKMKHYFGD
jgi:hypothetical protein